MSAKLFDIPSFTYFSEKNIYSGSASRTFNYKIWYGETFAAKVWYGYNAFESTPEDEIIGEFQAEFSENGLEQIKDWLVKQYDSFKQSAG